MSEYRIFAIGPDGRFAGEPKIVECIDDQEAIAIYRRSRLGGLDSYAPHSAASKVFHLGQAWNAAVSL